jgi:hypothetical protein
MSNMAEVQASRVVKTARRKVLAARGLAFTSEAALVRDVVALLHASGGKEWRVLREVDAKVGVADIVAVPILSDQSLAAAKALRTIPIRLAPLTTPPVSDQVDSVQKLMELTGMTRDSAIRAARMLEKAGLATRNGDYLEIHPIPCPPFQHVIAIEAKLRDWRRALVQAYRNLQFATQSWVVLDHHWTVNDNTLQAFARANVGLASYSVDGQLYIHVSANSVTPRNLQSMWQAQAAIARIPGCYVI